MNNGEDIIKLPQGVALGIENGKVVQIFYRATNRYEWEPHDAAQFGKQLIDAAVAAGAEVILQVPKRPITEAQRDRMVTRALHVMRSLTEKNKPPKYIALSVVDTIISMVD